jgi:hypothetical protein
MKLGTQIIKNMLNPKNRNTRSVLPFSKMAAVAILTINATLHIGHESQDFDVYNLIHGQ